MSSRTVRATQGNPVSEKQINKREERSGMVVHAYNPNTWKTETGGSRIPGHFEHNRDPLPNKKF